VTSNQRFAVSIDEVRQSFVFGELFSDGYTTSVTLSDGSVRQIALRPVQKDGAWVVELKDGDHVSYMGPNGSTTHGTLMIRLVQIGEPLEGVGLADT
jgi:hypothetical protein